MDYRVIADQLKLPPPTDTEVDDLQNVTFVAAVPADKLVPEVSIEGQKRGALSWAFSRALEGRADKDGDGKVSEFELLGYIVRRCMRWSKASRRRRCFRFARDRCRSLHCAREAQRLKFRPMPKA
jgi:hypothetical protein